MKLPLVVIITASLLVASCGHDHAGPPVVTTQILSDAVFDGDISQDPATLAFTVTQGTAESYFAGIDPATSVEYRTFLDFPLGGAGGVPLDAVISSALLDIWISNISLQEAGETIPIRIDLVDFQPPELDASFFDLTSPLPALSTVTIQPPISSADVSQHVIVDVTPLMVEAQLRGLSDFQVRILEDNIVPVLPGRIEINDTRGPLRNYLAPLLQVSYY